MLTIRPTQKLAKKIKAAVDKAVEAQENPLQDWHATLFTCGRTQYILFLNTATLYAAISYGAGVTDDDKFIKLFFSTVGDQMRGDGMGEAYEEHTANASDGIFLAKSVSRSATGIMTEYVKMAQYELAERSPDGVASLLNRMIWTPIDYEKPVDCLRAACDRLASATGP